MIALSVSHTLCVTSNPGSVMNTAEHRDPDHNVPAVHRDEDKLLTIQSTHQTFSLVSLPLGIRTTPNVCFQHHDSKGGVSIESHP